MNIGTDAATRARGSGTVRPGPVSTTPDGGGGVGQDRSRAVVIGTPGRRRIRGLVTDNYLMKASN